MTGVTFLDIVFFCLRAVARASYFSNVMDLPKEQQWKTFAEWGNKWGGLVHVSTFGRHVIVINDGETAVKMLNKKSNIYSDRPMHVMAGELVGWNNSITLAPYGDRLRKLRSLVHRAIGTRTNLVAFHGHIQAESYRSLQRLLHKPEALVETLRKTSGAIILSIFYGYHIQEDDDPLVHVADATMEGFSKSTEPGAWLVDIIPVEGTASPSFTLDLLQGREITPEEEELIKVAAGSMYGGGADTIVSAMQTFFLAMTLFPEVLQRGHLEIGSVVGNDRLPTLDDHLPYVEALVSEVLRWGPVAPLGFVHRVTEDDVQDGYLIPKGSTVLQNIWKMLHDPRTYKNPETFNPQRFLETNGRPAEQDPRLYCFGFGRRICPGMPFADASLFLQFATVLAVFNITKAVSKEGVVIEPVVEFTSGTVSSSADCTQLKLKCVLIEVRSSKDKEVLAEDESYEGFHPTFTYPIFGEEEKIYGYNDLVIDLRFASGSLAQYLDVKYSASLATSSTIDDVRGMLEKFIPADYYKTEEAFLGRVETEADTFKPMGDKVYSYTRLAPGVEGDGKEPEEGDEDAVVFEVYHAKWDTPGFKEYHRRMQFFILLYIEAGSYIQEEEEAWEFFVLKGPATTKVNSSRIRGLILMLTVMLYSQFVILPPYQRKGHGSALYTAIYQYVLSQSLIAELTVEDPAEAFEDLRDRNDLKMLLNHEQFMSEAFGDTSITASSGGGKVGGVGPHRRMRGKVSGKGKGKLEPPADKVWMEKWRKELKIAGRQFHRLVEMLILLHLNTTDARAMRAYRLQVKERLYRFNYASEVLVQMEDKERLEKLEETFRSVREDYQRILDMLH
ncbi:hypothetical protein EW146_g5517 [Bondarzewia mesenterica]|uniref:Histone acetyltransferase type B catalytic subunit n=1 Tax=Bondarzewia mesenterica TaxID=1095465 RepID=A0A4S4LS97_9AGAM|nr:hypothetical protein EW146_g5517 [Bondarzewia mesenterica]